MIVRILVVLLLGCLMQPFTAGDTFAWWSSEWPYRMQITADAGSKGANVTEPIGRTQVLIRLHSGNFNFDTANESGNDLRVVAGDDKTPLHFHIERFDGLVDQVGLIWVDVPDMAPGVATSFYLYWGNAKAQAGGDAKATYDPDQLLVYHFGDANGVPHDSTGYGNNALTAGKRDDGGMVGYGLRLDGTTPVRIPPSSSLTIAAGQAMTWSIWMHANDGVTTGVIYALRDGANAFRFGLDKGVAYAQIDTSASSARASGGPPLTNGWHHIAVTASDRIRLYVDGVPAGDAAATLPAMNGAAVLGADLPAPSDATAAPPSADTTTAPTGSDTTTAPTGTNPAPSNLGFAGVVDELQISKVVRPTGAFQLAVHDQGPQENLLTFGPPEQSSVLGNSYIGIIVRSVTPDAWVVIGALGVMGAFSWVVMITKALYLRRIDHANRAFRLAFREAAAHAETGLVELPAESQRALRHSPLFRLHRLGTHEASERVAQGRVDAQGRLVMQSLAAIRAALDAGLAQESQRLNRMMVLLTIAISGGPFLGLLGTVIGVMITFAAVAAAGDVNINAIAPGIAAALLATVAGLTVAIPALFGYNYFVTRIRDATVNMQVFVDELVTRIGEGVAPVHVVPADRRAAGGMRR